MKQLAICAAGVLLAAATGCSTTASDSSASTGRWTTLLDGHSVNGWNATGNANWQVNGGSVLADSGVGFLVSKNSYADFQLRVEFWADSDANSGVFLRCANPAEVSPVNCYEVNIFDKRPDKSGGTGSIVNVAPPKTYLLAGGQWNTYEITAKGSQLTVVLNGTTTVEAAQDTKHAAGPIALQRATGVIKFRKVQIRQL